MTGLGHGVPNPDLEREGATLSAPLQVRTESVRERDALAFLERHRGLPRCLVSRPGLVLAGVGVAASLEAGGPQRFRRIREAARLESRRLGLLSAEASGAAWMGGFSFEEGDESDPSFPSARFVLPQRLLRIDAEGARMVMVGPEPEAGVAVSSPPPTWEWRQDPSPEEWTLRVREALREIQAGRLDKLVLARRLEGLTSHPFDPVAVARRLQEASPSSTAFLFEPTPQEAWVGASPELLVRRDQGRVSTVALAGSRPRGATPQEDEAYERSLVASSKDAWEHELVCRAIRHALEERGRAWRLRSDRTVLKLPHVQHLESRFESGTSPDEHVLDLAERLHPTPAVCGGPREAARSWVRRLEARPRGWYAGAVGHFDAGGDGALHVAIRCARLRKGSATLWAGCGIVSGSDPADEWEESRTKFQTLLSAMEARA